MSRDRRKLLAIIIWFISTIFIIDIFLLFQQKKLMDKSDQINETIQQMVTFPKNIL